MEQKKWCITYEKGRYRVNNKRTMTHEEARMQVAKNAGYDSWSAIALNCDRTYDSEAAELYARSKWDEACQQQINICLNNLRHTFSDSLAYGDVASATKPEFKP